LPDGLHAAGQSSGLGLAQADVARCRLELLDARRTVNAARQAVPTVR
jgi:hypothetical protein